MSNYIDWAKEDWIAVFAEHIKKNLVIKLDDGRYKSKMVISIDITWIYSHMEKSVTGGNCWRYTEFLFGKMGFIPINCHECFKVVVMPRTVKELFTLYELQKQLGLPSKCGIETRPLVPRLYGGYFYNKGLEAGRECYGLIRKRVDERINPSIPVILKKGCTEFEMQLGSSDKWQILKGQEKVEAEFNKRYFEENGDAAMGMNQDSDMIASIKIRWCHFAAIAKPPDLTYKEFTGGKSLVQEVKYVTYHQPEPSRIVVPFSKKLDK